MAEWSGLFVGREIELQTLIAAWRKAKTGAPQFVVLLGESGLGKTRLAQEFYRWLQANEDPPQEKNPRGYWPDSFQNAGINLDVNPTFPADWPRAEIPWLWWGLRWNSIEGRNRPGDAPSLPECQRCALIDHLPTLASHIEPIDLRRKQKKNRRIKTAKFIGNIISNAAMPLQILYLLMEAGEGVLGDLAETKAREKLASSVASAREDRTQDLADKALEAFEGLLSADADKLPVILLLDDAQWADSVSVRFVWKLLARAIDKRWPLMVLVTHWEQEWRRNESDPPTAPPTRIAHLPRMPEYGDFFRGWTPMPVEPVMDLSAVCSAALPGLTSQQRRLLLEKSGGNPNLLEQIIRWLLLDDRKFVDDDLTQPLTADAEAEIAGRKFQLHELFAERFARLEKPVRRALGWSSLQGQRFLAAVTRASARAVDPSVTDEMINQALSRSESPHALIRLYGDAGRFNLGEFRQNAFREVALEYLRGSAKELAAVQQSLRQTLRDWLDNGQLDALPEAERLDALEMARVHLVPGREAGDAEWRRYAGAMIRLLALYRDNLMWQHTWRTADDIAAAQPSGWTVARMGVDDQIEVMNCLLEGNRIDRALALAGNLRRQIEQDPQRHPWRIHLAINWWFGQVLFQAMQYAHSAEFLDKALRIWDTRPPADIVPRESCSHVAWCLQHLAHIALEQRNLDAAEQIVQRLDSFTQEMQRAGLSAARIIRVRSICASNLGAIAQLRGDLPGAIRFFDRALAFGRESISLEPWNLPTVQSLANDANRLAQAFSLTGRFAEALPAVELSIATRRKLLAMQGKMPDAVGNLARGLYEAALVHARADRQNVARDMLMEAAQLMLELEQMAPLTPLQMRTVGIILQTLGDILNEQAARQVFMTALDYLQKASQAAPDSTLDKRNLANLLQRLAGLDERDGDVKSCRARWGQAIGLHQQIVAADPSVPAVRGLAGALVAAARSLLRICTPADAEPLAAQAVELLEAAARAGQSIEELPEARALLAAVRNRK